MKRIALICALLCGVFASSAQDIVTLRSGEKKSVKVKEVGSSEIKYQKESNPDGPIYVIDKSDVLRIDYPNGESDVFQEYSKSKGFFFRPEINMGALDGFAWGGAITFGYEFNPIFSLGCGSQLSWDVWGDFSPNVYAMAHANFRKTEGHWFGELRVGADFGWETALIEPIVGYEFKSIKEGKGRLQLSYGMYNLPGEGYGTMFNVGYKF